MINPSALAKNGTYGWPSRLGCSLSGNAASACWIKVIGGSDASSSDS